VTGLAQSLARGRSFMLFEWQVPKVMAGNKALTLLFHQIHTVSGRLVAANRMTQVVEPVEPRLAGHRRAILAARSELAREHRQHRIMAQLVVVVEILT
jgi:hypothetical protein